MSNKNYKSTFILDLRNSEDDPQKVLSDLTELVSTLGGSVNDSADLGLKDFVRAADRRFTQGHYLEFYIEAPATFPAGLKEKLRLDKRINRIFVEAC